MIVTIGNVKGGAGKSTVAFNIGVWLSQNSNVQFIDLDPQQTLNDTIEVRTELGFEPKIKKALQKVPDSFSPDIDYVIDVSVADKEAMFKALDKSDIVIVPCPPSQSDVWATGKFVDMLKLLYPKLTVVLFVNRADTHWANKDNDETTNALKQIKNCNFLETRLHNRNSYRKSFSEGLAVFEQRSDKKAIIEFNNFMQEIFE